MTSFRTPELRRYIVPMFSVALWAGLQPAIFAQAPVPIQEARGAVKPGGPQPSTRNLRSLPSAYASPLRSSARFALGSVSTHELQQTTKAGLRAIGVRRAVPASAFTSAETSVSPLGGRVWRLTLTSPQATGIRVHFLNFAAGQGQVWVYAPPAGSSEASGATSTPMAGPYSDGGVVGSGEFWSATVPGNTVVVEYDEKTGGGPAGAFPPFQIDAIAHRFAPAVTGATLAPGTEAGAPSAGAAGARTVAPKQGGGNGAASCELDVACYPGDAPLASGVVLLDFISGNSEYLCSGAMVQTGNNSFKPYMLTANHCISNNTEAQTLETFFKYQTSSCNGAAPALNAAGLPSVPAVEGAQFITGGGIGEGDFSLNLLNGDAPGGVYFFGWTTTSPNIGDPVAVIHHPAGSWTRVSFGKRSPDANVRISGGPQDPGTLAPASLYYQVTYTQGISQPGSSGSPLINSNGQIIGTLSAGDSPPGSDPPAQLYCSLTPFGDTFGRFADAYPAIQASLSGSAAPVSVTVNPSSLAFTESNGALTGTPQQTVAIVTQSTSGVPFTVQATDSWVQVSSNSGTVTSSLPANLTVTVNPLAYSAAGTYVSSLSITPAGGSPVSVPVFLTVNTGSVSASGASLTLVSEPNPIVQDPNATADCAWSTHLVVQETSGQASVTLTQFNLAGTIYTNSLQTTADGATTVSEWFNGIIVPAGGSLATDICSPAPMTVPTTKNMSVQGTDAAGNTVSAQTTANYAAAPASPASFDVEPGSVLLSQNYPSGQTKLSSQVTVTLGASTATWTASLAFDQLPTSWLTASPLSGTGSGTINLTANAASLAPGLYQATLFVQSPTGSPQYLLTYIELEVGGAGVNAASFIPGISPGGTLSLFGTGLSTGTQPASSLPLLTTMQGTQVMINGVAAPLLYVSSTQINLEIPYGTPLGTATATVVSNGKTVLTQPIYVITTAPGIYTSDGTHPVPSATAKLGSYLSLYLTGQGLVSPTVADGAAPSSSLPLAGLPAPLAPVYVYLGNNDFEQLATFSATISTLNGTTTPSCGSCFAAIPYGLVNTIQLNVLVPNDTSLLGTQPVAVQIGNVISNEVMVTFTQ